MSDKKAVPGAIMVYQTYGNSGGNFHPHIHGLITEGCFDSEGLFHRIDDLDMEKMRAYFRHAVLSMLKKQGLLSDEMIEKLMAWRHCSGFHIYNKAKVAAVDDDGRERLAKYLIRAPVALKRLLYDRQNQVVIYSGKGGDVTYDPLDFLAQLTLHIPNPKEQVIRYYGYYSNKSRGSRKRREQPEAVEIIEEEDNEASKRRRTAWARLIAKVYLDDPLTCPKCGGTMRVISWIEDPSVVKKILLHLGMWNDRERSPPPILPPQQIDLIDPDYGIEVYIQDDSPSDVP